jgi:hypothetical protein
VRKLIDQEPGVLVGGETGSTSQWSIAGELSKATIDSEWPHQVALLAERCRGRNHEIIRLFCAGLSLCPRGHSFRRDDHDVIVFCFAERAHAEQFLAHFGGEFIAPKDRPRWPRSR